eukprot:7155821-Prymnesium_polylepis.1
MQLSNCSPPVPKGPTPQQQHVVLPAPPVRPTPPATRPECRAGSASAEQRRAMTMISSPRTDVLPSLVTSWKLKLRTKAKKMDESIKSGLSPHEAAMKHKMGIRALDLYVWAVLLGNTELALVLLPLDVEPVRTALLGSCMCHAMAKLMPVESNEIIEAAEMHERWAISILDLCTNQDAATILLTTATRHWGRNLIGLATSSEMK